MKSKIYNKLKSHIKEVIEIKTSPESIAAGFSIGTLIAVLPTFGLGILIGLIVLFLFKKVSKISMFLAFAIWNPLVLLLLYPFEYALGNYLLIDIPITKFRLEILNQIFVYTGRYLLGSFIFATIISFISYFLIYFFSKKFQESKK